ncbi:macrophage mannose receptor 1-like [Pangasianodon hypophthalmus]|uniref:macrophage mannose receptor 1-like n=1 Tax=Pangasianodon hypophthalmus TaxID=310915 RepID=UPI002307A6B3|nr:macrophage mannose receptor 1-like [Pangasianodon hypophthalmus]
MKQSIYLFLCLTGLVPVILSTLETLSHNYYLIMTRWSWPDAQNYCRMMYNDLAKVISDVDFSQLKKEAERKGLAEAAWIGLYNDADSWRWSLNDVLLKSSTFIKWNPGEPDNYIGKEACGELLSIYGTWADAPCTILKPFVCYNANFSGAARFIGVASPALTWLEAQAYCRTHHTDLASSLNSLDNDLIIQVVNKQGDSWIGLYRYTWKWLDGTNASNLPWYPGQPSNKWGNENCAAVYNELFIDEQCANLHYFFCYTISPVKSQIMRLQVKSDGSVFDPAMQSSILEQMKQKLEENSVLENITVAWRVQPDRNIFYKKNKHDLK